MIDVTPTFWIVVVLAFCMSYAIGANDAANALATSYGSNAAPLLLLLICGAVMEVIGAVWCSGAVVTLAEKMI
jgi:phosphate/sulfate permease